jgi:hypothetical protein
LQQWKHVPLPLLKGKSIKILDDELSQENEDDVRRINKVHYEDTAVSVPDSDSKSSEKIVESKLFSSISPDIITPASQFGFIGPVSQVSKGVYAAEGPLKRVKKFISGWNG